MKGGEGKTNSGLISNCATKTGEIKHSLTVSLSKLIKYTDKSRLLKWHWQLLQTVLNEIRSRYHLLKKNKKTLKMNKICSIVTLALGAIGVFSGILTVVFYPDLYHYIMKLVSTWGPVLLEGNSSSIFLATRCYLGLVQLWPLGGDSHPNAYEHLLFQCDQRGGGYGWLG